MTFETKHSPIFFAEAIESILRQIRIHSQVKILNYCDDTLLIHQDNQTIKLQTMEIIKTLEQMDMDPEGNEYKSVGRVKTENDISFERFVQPNKQKQMCEDKITSSAERQTELPETPDKISVFISNGIRQSEDTSVEDRIMEWNNDSEMGGIQRTEMTHHCKAEEQH
ncbi:MAG: hypothetical protein EZS28_038052 [Streblomastix strix]|uniref:Reverse transcriptase domain-containing protein n=1 Tax=Streblomastix strix TaxID=222440 RepID=A0A5J4U963_9EUKA|nr:MAG: hypothetical protein EZS28_038052 [Streblomastix strix]